MTWVRIFTFGKEPSPSPVFLVEETAEEALVIPGPPGAAGAAGAPGLPGSTGLPGFDGEDGEPALMIPGAVGPQGQTGAQGAAGYGPPGADADEAIDWPPLPGPVGPQGQTGGQGPAGYGPPGTDGMDADMPMMIPGAVGPQGQTGSQGPAGYGPPGLDGDDSDASMLPLSHALQPTEYIGPAQLGIWPAFGTTIAFFGNSYLDQTNLANFCLLQDSSGNTQLNSASGGGITFSIGNNTVGIWNASSLTILNTLKAGLTLIGQTSDDGTGKLQVTGPVHLTRVSQTVASAASATWDGFHVGSSTLTLTGTTQVTTATGLNMATFEAPTITDASAVTVDKAATVAIIGAPAAAGSVTLTTAYSLWVIAGATRLASLLLDAALPVASGGTAATSLGNSVTNSGGVFNTIQGIRTTDSPTFASLVLSGNTTATSFQCSPTITTASVKMFSFSPTFTATSGISQGLNLGATQAPASASSAQLYGLNFAVASNTGSNVTGTQFGCSGASLNIGAGTLSLGYCFSGVTQIQGSGAMTTATTFNGQAQLQSTGSITVYTSFLAASPSAFTKGISGTTSLVGGSGFADGTYTLGISSGNATGTYTCSGGAVTGITITYPGSGYSVAPTLTFPSGGGSGASATATLAAGTMTFSLGHFADNQGLSGITNAGGMWIKPQSGATNNISLLLGSSFPTGTYQIYASAATLNYINGRILFGTTTDDTSTQVQITPTDAGTNANLNVLMVGHNSSGTPAAGFGTGILFNAQDSTTANTNHAQIRTAWYVATHATRTSNFHIATISANQTLVDRLHLEAAKTLTNALTSLFDIALTAGSMAGGKIVWTIESSDGTDFQSYSGITMFAAVNKGGVYTTNIVQNTSNDAKAVSAGTLTVTWAIANGTNKVTVQLTPATSLTATTYRITYAVLNNSPSAITAL